MTLKLNLAPGESVLIGKARVQNGGTKRCALTIYGTETILRESRIMRESEANTPAKRLYYVVLSLYVADDKESLYSLYHDVARELVLAYPVLTLPVTDIGQHILNGNIYEALNCAHLLIEFETQLQSPPNEETA